MTAVLTSGCNLTCSYCYQNAKSGRRMDWPTLRQAVDTLLASREDDVDLAFYGGEPMIRFDMICRAVDYVESHRRPDQHVGYSTITNGTLIGETEAEFLARHDFELQLSIDGVPEVQALRGAGTFETLDRLLDRLAGDHPKWFAEKITVSATVLPTTIGFLADSVGYFLAKGLGSIRFSPGSTDTSGWKLDQIQELENQFERIFQLSRRQYRRSGRIPVECLREPQQPRARIRPHAMCNVEGAEELTVDVDGQVYGCAMFADSYQELPTDFLRRRLERLELGGVRDPDLNERMAAYPEAVARAEIFHRHDAKYSGYGECRTCECLEHCFVCPVSIGQTPEATDPHRIPDFLCAFSLVSNRYRQRMAAEPGWLQWIKDLGDSEASLETRERR